MLVICCCITNYPKTSSSHRFFSHPVSEYRIQKWLCRVAWAHIGPLMWWQSHCRSGRSHLRVWLGLENPLLRWLVHVAIGRRPRFFPHWLGLFRAAWASLCHSSRLPQGEWLRAGTEGGEGSLFIIDSRIFFKLLSKVFQINMLVVISQMRNVCITCIKFTSCSSGSVSFCLQNNCHFNTKS